MKPHLLIKRAAIVAMTIFLAFVPAAAQTHYTVHQLSGNVKITRGGKTVPAEKGSGVSGSDYITLSEGEEIQILHKAMHKIYVWNTPGKISVSSLIIKAKHLASDNGAAVGTITSFSKRDKDEQTVYSTVGRTTRSMAKFDPEARNMQVEPSALAAILAPKLLTTGFSEADCPVSFSHSFNDSIGAATFTMANTLHYPVYFNVLKVTNVNSTPKVEISELGQPTGNYVVRPGQTLMRGQEKGLGKDERHIVVITQCFFDIDRLLEAIDGQIASPDANAATAGIPVFVGAL